MKAQELISNGVLIGQIQEWQKGHGNNMAYMWSDPISSGPTDIGPPNTSHARQTETPDIYEFRFFAFAKS